MTRRVVATSAALIVTVAALAACSSNAKPAASATATVTVTVTATATSAATSAVVNSRSTTPAASGAPLPIGGVLHSESVTAAVLGFQPKSAGSSPNAAVLVRVCANPNSSGITASNAPWSLQDAQDGNYQTYVTGGGLQEPQYPSEPHPLAPGQCVQGWITIVVTPTSKIVTATYQPDAGSNEPQTGGRWRVG